MPVANGGLNEFATAAFPNHAAYTLVAYTNAVGSLTATSVAADVSVVTTSNGYAPITLTPANWSVSSTGVATYPTAGTIWTATGSWSGTVNGVAIIYSTKLIAYQDFTGVAPIPGPWVASNARKLQVDLNTLLG